jgi:hypothetical protein
VTGGAPHPGGAAAGPDRSIPEETSAMTSTRTTRLVASLRLLGVTVALAAGIAGFAATDTAADPTPVQLDLAVVSTSQAG